MSVFAHLRDVPAGDLDVKVKAGSGAGDLQIAPLPAPIGRIEVDLTTTGEKNTNTHVVAEAVRLRVVQWDIDGHTDYPGMPKAIYLDSARSRRGGSSLTSKERRARMWTRMGVCSSTSSSSSW